MTAPASARDSGSVGGSARRRAAASFLVVTLLFSFTHWYARDGFDDFEATVRDIQARSAEPRTSRNVVVIHITDADYADLFGGRSPLDRNAVLRLLTAVMAGHPRIVGVDLETSDPSWRAGAPAEWAGQVVWARTGTESEQHAGGGTSPARGISCAVPTFVPDAVLAAPAAATGLVMFDADARGTVRLYRRVWTTPTGGIPSLAFALTGGRDGATRTAADSVCPRYIRYRPSDTVGYTAAQVLDLNGTGGHPDSLTAAYRGANGPLAGKIVLVGGSYRAARDRHFTPFGLLNGVDVLAQVVNTELEGGARVVPPGWKVTVLQFIAALPLLLVFAVLPFRRATALSVALTPGLTAAASWWLTGSAFAAWPHFAPLLLLVFTTQLIQAAEEYRTHHVRELHAMAGSRVRAMVPRWRGKRDGEKDESGRKSVEQTPT